MNREKGREICNLETIKVPDRLKYTLPSKIDKLNTRNEDIVSTSTENTQ